MTMLTTFSTVGLAEDVSQTLVSISPTSVPFTSSIKSEKVSARTFEWLEDSIRSVSLEPCKPKADAMTIA